MSLQVSFAAGMYALPYSAMSSQYLLDRLYYAEVLLTNLDTSESRLISSSSVSSSFEPSHYASTEGVSDIRKRDNCTHIY